MPIHRTPRKLHKGHFAFMRALVQGLDERAAWNRYLAQEGDATDLRLVNSTIARIRGDFAAAARREHKPGTARLVLMNTALLADDVIVPVAVAQRPAPSLDEFIAEAGMDGFSEDEQIEAYQARYGSEEPPSQRARLQRKARLIQQQLTALDWLERLVTQAPAAGDGVEAWFAPSLAARLRGAGLGTLRLVADRINGVGWRWWTIAPGIGEKKGERITDWMRLHMASTQLVIGEHALLHRAALSAQQLAEVVPAGTALVPLEKFRVPAELDGSQGLYRAPLSLLSARNDYEAINAWLASKREQPNTQRAYRREAERLLLWAILEQGKALSSLSVEDAQAYIAFLQAPPERWCAPRHRQRWSPLWRPLEGPLSDTARLQALRILNTLYAYLMKQAYVIGNPFASVRPPKPPVRPLGSGRTLTRQQWDHLQAVAEADLSPIGRRRARALNWLYATGLRTAELCAARCGHLISTDYIDEGGALRQGWLLEVIGKGNKLREVVVPAALVQQLQRYLWDHGRGDITAERNAGLAILAKLEEAAADPNDARAEEGDAVAWEEGRFADAKTEPDAKDEPGWTPSGLYKSIKALMHQAAAELEGADAQRLMKASTHWLRHTHGSHSLASGVVPVEVVRRNMGHASLDTLSGYVTTERDEGIRAIERFVGRA